MFVFALQPHSLYPADATVPNRAFVDIPAVARNGKGGLNISASLVDALNQTISFWPDLQLQARTPLPHIRQRRTTSRAQSIKVSNHSHRERGREQPLIHWCSSRCRPCFLRARLRSRLGSRSPSCREGRRFGTASASLQTPRARRTTSRSCFQVRCVSVSVRRVGCCVVWEEHANKTWLKLTFCDPSNTPLGATLPHLSGTIATGIVAMAHCTPNEARRQRHLLLLLPAATVYMAHRDTVRRLYGFNERQQSLVCVMPQVFDPRARTCVCLRGRFKGPTSTTCELCGVGTFAPQEGMTECTPCSSTMMSVRACGASFWFIALQGSRAASSHNG